MDNEKYLKYLKYKAKYMNLKQKVQTGGSMNKNDIMLFKMNNCGYCTQFMPVWQHLIKEFSNKYNFITYDSTKDINKVNEYNVNGFPTLIKKNGNTLTQYDGDRDYESVKYFIMN